MLCTKNVFLQSEPHHHHQKIHQHRIETHTHIQMYRVCGTQRRVKYEFFWCFRRRRRRWTRCNRQWKDGTLCGRTSTNTIVVGNNTTFFRVFSART